jgi:hypothetical protein
MVDLSSVTGEGVDECENENGTAETAHEDDSGPG